MQKKSIEIFCSGHLIKVMSLPKSFVELRKQLRNLSDLPKSYSVLLANSYNSKSPVTNNKGYQRFLLTNECIAIHIIDQTSVELDEELPELKKNSKFLKRKQKSSEEVSEIIPEEEMCVICCGRYQEPMQAKCKHVFCKGCWERTLKNFLECPLCKTRVRIPQLEAVNKTKICNLIRVNMPRVVVNGEILL